MQTQENSEFQNLLRLLDSTEPAQVQLGLQLARNYQSEFEEHYGYSVQEHSELVAFLLKNGAYVTAPLNEITQLYIVDKGITELPECIIKLPKLEIIELNDNLLTTLPNNIWKLQELFLLDISFNQFKTLPETLGNLNQLRLLNATDNQIEFLPSSFDKLTSLRDLFLTNNYLQTLPPDLGNLVQMEEIRLEYNQLKTLPKELCNLTNCKIYVRDNPNLVLPPELEGWENIVF
jgi:leucine-rich repeat protein SHOC2